MPLTTQVLPAGAATVRSRTSTTPAGSRLVLTRLTRLDGSRTG